MNVTHRIERLARLALAVASGLGLTMILFGSVGIMHGLITRGNHLVAGKGSELPQLTQWVDDILPEQDFAIVGSFCLFLTGCIWLDWQERPLFRAVMERLVLGFCVVGVIFSYLPIHLDTACLCSRIGTSLIDDLIWLALCSVPLVVAWRRHRRLASKGAIMGFVLLLFITAASAFELTTCGPGYIPVERAWKERDTNLHDWTWVDPGSQAIMEKAIREVLK